jgi:acetyl esterase/lipase
MTTLERPFCARHRKLFWLFVLLALALCDWAPDSIAQGRRRHRPDFSEMTVQRDIVYRQINARSLRLDIYTPKTITHSLPVAIWIHGAIWRSGTKDQRAPVNLVARGYAMVNIEYRPSAEAPFPAQIEDCKAAVRWIRAHAATYHFDPDHIGAWGHSAGGHLAALLGTSGDVAALEGGGDNLNYSSRIQAVVDLSGPIDLVDLYRSLGSAGGHRGRAQQLIAQFLGGSPEQNQAMAIAASPTTYVSSDDAPILIIHGEHDRSIPVDQSKLFAQKLKAAGVDVTLIVADRGHSVRAAGFGREIVSFFDRNLKRGATE